MAKRMENALYRPVSSPNLHYLNRLPEHVVSDSFSNMLQTRRGVHRKLPPPTSTILSLRIAISLYPFQTDHGAVRGDGNGCKITEDGVVLLDRKRPDARHHFSPYGFEFWGYSRQGMYVLCWRFCKRFWLWIPGWMDEVDQFTRVFYKLSNPGWLKKVTRGHVKVHIPYTVCSKQPELVYGLHGNQLWAKGR